MIHWDKDHLRAIRLRLIQARELKGYSQGAAAQALGIARPTLSWIESGDQSLRVTDLLALCDLYGVKPSQILRPGLIVYANGPEELRAANARREECKVRCLTCGGKGLVTKTGRPTSSKRGFPCAVCKGKGEV